MVEQVRVRPLLHHLPFVDHRDRVGPPHRGQPVGHHDGRPPGRGPAQRLLHAPLRLRVERAGRLVEQQDPRLLEERPRDRDPLPLPPGELRPSLPDPRLVPPRHARYELVRVRLRRRLHHLRLRRRLLPVRDVLVDRRREEARLLRDDRDGVPERLQVVLADVLPVHQNAPGARLVEPLDQRQDRALPAPAGPDQGERAPGAGAEAQVPQDGQVGLARVREVHVPQLHLPAEAFRHRGGVGVVRLDLRLAVDDLEDGLHRPAALDEVGGEGEGLRGAVGGHHEDHEDADRLGEVGDAVLDEVGGVPQA
ncbi:PGP1 isoform X1 [Iris pallida]|uniref:PGP1 isoform X1 n=1 Tax=Iris pallida TaxID=29817 RepID=A0AAX6E401_IRIPA|nr:PGP1 isoform X1 [Iris pallida]